MSFVLPGAFAYASPYVLAAKPITLSPIPTGITIQTVVPEPPKVEVKKTVEEVTTTTEVKETTTTTTEVPVVTPIVTPVVASTWFSPAPVSFLKFSNQKEKKKLFKNYIKTLITLLLRYIIQNIIMFKKQNKLVKIKILKIFFLITFRFKYLVVKKACRGV